MRCAITSILFTALFTVFGCASTELPELGVPTSVVLDGNTGDFSLRIDAEKPITKDTMLGEVPVVSVYGEEQYAGLIVRPGTRAWDTIRPNAALPTSIEEIRFPTRIYYRDGEWHLFQGQRRVLRTTLDEARHKPVWAAVPVQTPIGWHPPIEFRGLIQGEDRQWQE
ncbi:MAG: hypothetical protein K2Y21_11125 [Phycisphaerales bacterium]|nr:hypothetical protein [Phycisphaerales bacterium]